MSFSVKNILASTRLAVLNYGQRLKIKYADDVKPPKDVKDLPRAMRETASQTVRYFFAPLTALFRE